MPEQHEGTALMATVNNASPVAPTACAGWTTHDIVAHLAAGSKEIADLIEEKLAGSSPRPTRDFASREASFRALPDDQLVAAWSWQAQRKTEAVAALAELGEDAAFEFTGATLTAAQIATHSRSEAAIHRWDIAGEDAVSVSLLRQPELTAHAITVLNGMPVLLESSRERMKHASRHPLRIVLRSPNQPDVVLVDDADGNARFELAERPADGDAVVEVDAAARLLTIWGRRSSTRPERVIADEATQHVIETVLWPDAVEWPRRASK
jgi:uncharacterized protein (TIGR03083 family)